MFSFLFLMKREINKNRGGSVRSQLIYVMTGGGARYIMDCTVKDTASA